LRHIRVIILLLFLIQHTMKRENKVIRAIMQWKVHVKIEKVSSSWMTRRMSYYMWDFINITEDICEMSGYKQDKNWYLVITWCGMDMVFYSLYNTLPYKKRSERKQQYKLLN